MTTPAKKPARQASPNRGPGHGIATDTPHPQVALLSNQAYRIVITDAGAGVSTWRDLDVTRWREDATRDCWGQFVYIRSPEDGRVWSIGPQPLPQAVGGDGVRLTQRRAGEEDGPRQAVEQGHVIRG